MTSNSSRVLAWIPIARLFGTGPEPLSMTWLLIPPASSCSPGARPVDPAPMTRAWLSQRLYAVCSYLDGGPGIWLATSEDLPSHYVFGLDDPPSWAHDASWVRVRKPNLVRM